MSTVTYPSVEENEQPFGDLPIQKFLTWLFLASEVMFFTGLIVAYVVLRFNSESWHIPPELNVPLVAGNTFILIVSSVTMVLALENFEEGKYDRGRYFLLATMALGIVFLSIQAIEWGELLNHGILPSTDLFGATFFTLTGFHGAHVTGGVIWILGVTIAAFRGSYKDSPIGVEVLGLYWHFVDLVWIILFTIVYLIPV